MQNVLVMPSTNYSPELSPGRICTVVCQCNILYKLVREHRSILSPAPRHPSIRSFNSGAKIRIKIKKNSQLFFNVLFLNLMVHLHNIEPYEQGKIYVSRSGPGGGGGVKKDMGKFCDMYCTM